LLLKSEYTSTKFNPRQLENLNMAKQIKKPSGFIFYRGPSLIDGAPIVAVAITKKSSNEKTGNMVQTYILVDNGKSPVDNAKALLDRSICGDCIHRRGLDGSCYVNLGQGPRAVLDGVNRGIYPHSLETAAIQCTGRKVRLGAYGDPAAVPFEYWQALLVNAAGNTGYSHQWRTGINPGVMQYCMASADTAEQALEAQAKGYRTFRVKTAAEINFKNEFPCPASAEQGKRKLCHECMACNGGIETRKANPVIIVHGSLKSRFESSLAKVA